MAKPIRKTPTLKGEEVEKFISQMIKCEKRSINRHEKKWIELISS